MLTVQNVSKLYRLYDKPTDRLLELLPFAGRKRCRDFWALRDVSLRVDPGEIVAIVGPNGSGKSTLLQVVSGILQPTRGRVLVRGRIAALLELGAGFNPDFTGRENVRMSGEILGLSRAAVERAFPSIEAFAEIGDFIDRPVREYSSGMYVRLAFSTAIHVEPEILIVDEALAVGDAIFARRCVQKFEELKERKVTVLFVSHDLGLVKRLADRAVLMMHGKVEAEGEPAGVVNRYVGLVHEWQSGTAGTVERIASNSFRHGDGASRIVEVYLEDESGARIPGVRSGSEVTVVTRAVFVQPVDSLVVGILIRNRLGIDVFGTNTRVEGVDLGRVGAGDEVEVRFTMQCLLARGDYALTVATQYGNGGSQDWIDDVLAFEVGDARDVAGIASLPVRVEWEKRPARAPVQA